MRPSITLGLALALVGAIVAGFVKTTGARADRENHELGRVAERMKTVCVGRFLMDMPAEAQVDIFSASIGGFGIVAHEETVDEFRTRLAQREAALLAKPDRYGGNKNLESVREIKTDSGLIGKIFVHSRSVNEGTAGNGVENEHYRYEGIAVEGLVHGEGVSLDVGSDYYFPDKIEDLHSLITQLVPNPRNEAPHEPAFCMDRAYLRDLPEAGQREQITMSANLPSHPDFDFTLFLLAGVNPDADGLLKRGDASEAKLTFIEKMRISRLRAAPRKIGGLSGEELVRRVHEHNDSIAYSFRWEVNGVQHDVLTPHLVLSMMTGKSNDGPVPTSMSQAAVLGLWDRISSSIRPVSADGRNVAPAKASSAPKYQEDRL